MMLFPVRHILFIYCYISHFHPPGAGRGAVQIVQRIGARGFFTVASKDEVKTLSAEFGINPSAISTHVTSSIWTLAAKTWMSKNDASSFDLIYNSTGSPALATGVDMLSLFGSYIHNKTSEEAVELPLGATSTHIVDVATLAEKYPSKLRSFLGAVVDAHTKSPFKLSSAVLSFTDLTRPVQNISAFEVLVINTVRPENVRVDPAAQLFDPRKSYLLIGGCSEFGIGITIWMFNHGARNIYLTSRRGRKALSPVDKLYLRHINNNGGDARAISSNALKKEDMAELIKMAESRGPIGGIMLMTVVLRDSSFANLTQQHFDDVYESKVSALNVILELVNLAKIDFTLLFSTIGTVFGNAGQAPYLAAQL
jgi:KR domain